MSGANQAEPIRGRARAIASYVVMAALLTAVGVLSLRLAYPYRVGPKQPIPFSHRVHAGDKQVSCFFCHPFADQGPVPGVPEVSTCLLCHDRIIPHFPPIQQLRRMARRGEPVEWVRVLTTPDFVRFDHQMHLRKGVDCGRCHGNVKAMDRVLPAHDLSMGFCVDCHRAEGASDDCLICHH